MNRRIRGHQPIWKTWPSRVEAGLGRRFERIVTHRGIVQADPLAAFARLQRARALAALNRTDARRGYEELFALWREADAQLATLKRAKAEYDALR